MPTKILGRLEHDLIRRRDLRLVKAVLAGSKDAFAKLMSYYKVRVFSFGKNFFRNETDAEDFVQDVFIKVFTRLETFKGNSLFSTWLMRIAYTTALNTAERGKKYLPIADEDALIAADLTPEEREIRRVTQAAVREAVTGLPEKYFVCIDLYFSYDIPYREISEITDFPVNTIKSHIFRAKKLLKKKLEELYEE